MNHDVLTLEQREVVEEKARHPLEPCGGLVLLPSLVQLSLR
jgi:hypothetical protein